MSLCTTILAAAIAWTSVMADYSGYITSDSVLGSHTLGVQSFGINGFYNMCVSVDLPFSCTVSQTLTDVMNLAYSTIVSTESLPQLFSLPSRCSSDLTTIGMVGTDETMVLGASVEKGLSIFAMCEWSYLQRCIRPHAEYCKIELMVLLSIQLLDLHSSSLISS